MDSTNHSVASMLWLKGLNRPRTPNHKRKEGDSQHGEGGSGRDHAERGSLWAGVDPRNGQMGRAHEVSEGPSGRGSRTPWVKIAYRTPGSFRTEVCFPKAFLFSARCAEPWVKYGNPTTKQAKKESKEPTSILWFGGFWILDPFKILNCRLLVSRPQGRPGHGLCVLICPEGTCLQGKEGLLCFSTNPTNSGCATGDLSTRALSPTSPEGTTR